MNEKTEMEFQVMLGLIGMIKPLLGVMCIAIIMGCIGNLMASFYYDSRRSGNWKSAWRSDWHFHENDILAACCICGIARSTSLCGTGK